MIRKLPIILFVFLSILSLDIIKAQGETPPVKVEVSKEKVMIDGKLYYIHIVKSGQTLFSISRAYGVSKKEIGLENPGSLIEIQVGQALKIPAIATEEDKLRTKESDKFIYHYAKAGETIYRLSVEYEVEQEDIYHFNPQLRKDDLKIGQLVLIPKNRVILVKEEFKAEDEKYFYHKVKPKETLNSLERQYDISKRKIKRANEGLKKGLLMGDIIKIPKKKDQIKDYVNRMFQEPLVKDTLQQDTLDNEIKLVPVCDLKEVYYRGQEINVALLIPFFLEENERLNAPKELDSLSILEREALNKKVEKVKQKRFRILSKSYRFLHYYEGMLLALDSLRKLGANLNVKVYDTEKDTNRMKLMIESGVFDNSDLIIGPIYPDVLKIMSSYALENKKYIISPLSAIGTYTKENPYFIQAKPSVDLQLKSYAKRIAKNYMKNIVLIHEGNTTDKQKIHLFKEYLFSYFEQDTLLDEVSFKEVVYNDSLNSIKHALIKDTNNIVVVASSNVGFCSEIVSSLYSLASLGYDIDLYGYMRWENFGLDPAYSDKLKLKIVTPSHIDYKEAHTKKFIKRFRGSFRDEPNMFAYQGYDVVYYFVSGMMKYGNTVSDCLDKYKAKGIQTYFDFKRYDGKGFINQTIYHLEYKNYQYHILPNDNDF